MRDFFPRSPAADDDEPVDLAQVRADDALIEALRRTPLFEEPAPASAGWLHVVPDRPEPGSDLADLAGSDLARSDAAGPGSTQPDDTTAFDADADAELAAFARFADIDAVTDAPVPGDGDARIAALLQAWRSELDATPLPAPMDLQVAAAIVRSAPRRRRSVRPMIAVAAAIAGLLLGSTAIGARSATPDNTLLWPVTQLLWGDKADQVLASIEVRQGIDGAAKALDAGHPDQAEAALDHVTVVITKVTDTSERNTLQSDLGRVQSQLESSRASATSPSSAGTTGAVPTTGGTTPAPVGTSAPSAVSSAPVVDPPVTSVAPTTDPGGATTTPDQPTSEPPPSDPTSESAGTTGATSVESTPETPTSTEATTTATPEPTPSPAPEPVAPADDVPPAENVSPDQVPTG